MHVVVIGGWAPSLLGFRGPLLTELVRRGHRVTAMAPEGTAALRGSLAELGVTFEELALERAGLDPRRDLGTAIQLTRRLRALRPDVLLTYTIKPNIYGGLAAQLAGVPRRFALVTGLGYSFLGQERRRRRVFARFVGGLYRAALRGVDGVFFQNPDDASEFERLRILPTSADRVVVNGSGVDLATFRPAPLPPGPPRFLFVGRLLIEKGFVEFVDAARLVRARHPTVRFRALGWLDANPACVARADVERWTRAGVVEHLGVTDDVRPVIADHHVVVLPSYREGTPRSILEAMAMGRPAIVTDAPGCRETVIDGENGFLVPPRDAASIAVACERFVAEPELVARFGARGRAIAETRFDARAVASRMADAMAL